MACGFVWTRIGSHDSSWTVAIRSAEDLGAIEVIEQN